MEKKGKDWRRIWARNLRKGDVFKDARGHIYCCEGRRRAGGSDRSPVYYIHCSNGKAYLVLHNAYVDALRSPSYGMGQADRERRRLGRDTSGLVGPRNTNDEHVRIREPMAGYVHGRLHVRH